MSKELCHISNPSSFAGQAASSARLEEGLRYRDIEMLIARGPDGKPEIRLNLKIDFAEEKHSLRNRPNHAIFQSIMGLPKTFNLILIMLGLALADGGFKNIHTIDEIFGFKPPLNGDAWILEWADPLQQLVSSISSPISPIQWPSQCTIQGDPGFGAKLIGHTEKDILSSYYMKYTEMVKRFSARILAERPSRPLTIRILPAPPSPVLQTPIARHLSGVSTVEIDSKTYGDIRHERYKCASCENLVYARFTIWRCAICRCVRHYICAKVQYTTTHGERWHCPGCSSPHDGLPKDMGWLEYKMELMQLLRMRNTSNRKARIYGSKSKRRFEELDEIPIIIKPNNRSSPIVIESDGDKPLFKIRKRGTLGIDGRIKETSGTKEEVSDGLPARISGLTEDCEVLVETRVYILN